MGQGMDERKRKRNGTNVSGKGMERTSAEKEWNKRKWKRKGMNVTMVKGD